MTENRQTLGEFLRTEREKQGLSLDQVSSVTKIGVRVLQALERDRYSELPALPFVKGFIKTYCRLLQLNTNEVLSEFDSFLKEQSKSRPNREGGMSGYAFEKPEGEQAKKMLWVVMGTMLVFGVLVVFIFKPSLKHRKHGSVAKLQASASPSPVLASPSPSLSVAAGAEASASPAPSVSGSPSPVPSLPIAAASPSPTAVASPSPAPSLVQVPVPSPVASPTVPAVPVVLVPVATQVSSVSPSPSPEPSPSASIAAKPDPLQSGVDYVPTEVKYKVIIRALADVWVRYQCDDKKVMRFLLKEGRILVLRGKNTLKLQVSNPEAISLNSNGRRYRTMGAIPQVFTHVETPTLVWPLDARSRVQEIFNVSGALPETPAPTAAEPPPLDSTSSVENESSPE